MHLIHQPAIAQTSHVWTYALVGVAAIVAILLLYHALRWAIWYARRYIGYRTIHVVRPGALIRSGQLSPAHLEKLHRQHGLKTIVCLRGSVDEGKRNVWSRMEQDFCRRHNINFVSIPCNHKAPPTDQDIDQFLSIMADPAQLPVLLHCKLGRQRTGLFAAVYRLVIERATEQDVRSEMDRFDFQPHKQRHKALAAVLERTIQRFPSQAAPDQSPRNSASPSTQPSNAPTGKAPGEPG